MLEENTGNRKDFLLQVLRLHSLKHQWFILNGEIQWIFLLVKLNLLNFNFEIIKASLAPHFPRNQVTEKEH